MSDADRSLHTSSAQPTSPEQPELLLQLDAIVGPIRERAISLLTNDPTTETAEAAQKSPNARACERFKALRTLWHALAAQQRDPEVANLFDQLHAYFLTREGLPEDTDNFTLKNASNAIVRVYADDQKFLAALLAHIMAKGRGIECLEDLPEQRLAMKAMEFDASRKRRLGFDHYGKPGEQFNEERRDALATEAEAALQKILLYWRAIGDTVSQTRTLYELGMIEYCRQKWEKAAMYQNESAIVAENTGNPLGAAIARIEGAEILLKSDADPQALVGNFRTQTARIQMLAQQGLITARSWVSNALKCQATACITLMKKEHTAGRTTTAQEFRKEAIVCAKRMVDDDGCYLASLGEEARKIQEIGRALLNEAEKFAIN